MGSRCPRNILCTPHRETLTLARKSSKLVQGTTRTGAAGFFLLVTIVVSIDPLAPQRWLRRSVASVYTQLSNDCKRVAEELATCPQNDADGGEGGSGGSDGSGVGGGVYNLGVLNLDSLTDIIHNHASTSHDNIFP